MNLARRDILFGLACVAAFGGAAAARPREERRWFKGDDIGVVIPAAVPGWVTTPDMEVVMPRTEGSLASRLYASTAARVFVSEDERHQVALLLAYGATQSDGLQLHRPEACYPAVGYTIVDRRMGAIELGGRRIPTVELTATFGERVEDIVYFTRLGDAFPQTSQDQQRDRFQAALAGYIGDGVLVRASAPRIDGVPQFDALRSFMVAMFGAVKPALRPVLTGGPLPA